MALRLRLQWVEVDLPEILSYKEKILEKENRVVRWGTNSNGPF